VYDVVIICKSEQIIELNYMIKAIFGSSLFFYQNALFKKVINRQKPPFPVLFRWELASRKAAKNNLRKKEEKAPGKKAEKPKNKSKKNRSKPPENTPPIAGKTATELLEANNRSKSASTKKPNINRSFRAKKSPPKKKKKPFVRSAKGGEEMRSRKPPDTPFTPQNRHSETRKQPPEQARKLLKTK
jgi:hypothetical protein